MATFVVLRSRTMSSLVPAIGRRTITSLTQPVINGARSCSHLSRLNPCRSVVQPSTTLVRSFGIFGPDKTPLDIKMVESRVMKICGSYDKIDASSVSWNSGSVSEEAKRGGGRLGERFVLWFWCWRHSDHPDLLFVPLIAITRCWWCRWVTLSLPPRYSRSRKGTSATGRLLPTISL